MSASEKLRKKWLSKDYEDYDDDDEYEEGVSKTDLNMTEKLADEASSDGDVRATYLKAQAPLCGANNSKRKIRHE